VEGDAAAKSADENESVSFSKLGNNACLQNIIVSDETRRECRERREERDGVPKPRPMPH
jgi:hypothetical protein